MAKIRVAELFAGVGGFSLPLRDTTTKSATGICPRRATSKPSGPISGSLRSVVATVRSALLCRAFRRRNPCQRKHRTRARPGGSGRALHSAFDMLVGGFPCQDYSWRARIRNRGHRGQERRALVADSSHAAPVFSEIRAA
ncbi:MAG: DNA cytosine methyltransferase [Eggerthellaceae bacterium]